MVKRKEKTSVRYINVVGIMVIVKEEEREERPQSLSSCRKRREEAL